MISLFTSADEQLKTRSAELFFIIAKQNADRFISITGYGNGAGLLYDAGMFSDISGFWDFDFYHERVNSKVIVVFPVEPKFIEPLLKYLKVF